MQYNAGFSCFVAFQKCNVHRTGKVLHRIIGRKEMKRLVALALCAMMAIGLCACGDSAANGGGAPADAGAAATGEAAAEEEAPQIDESLIAADGINVCIASEPDNIDPALNSAIDGATLIIHTFAGLAKWEKKEDGSFVIAPDCVKELVEGEEGEDGTVKYTYTLLDDLKWSDGQPLTAGDFEFAWKRAADPATASDYGYMFDQIVGYDEMTEQKETGEVDEDGAPVMEYVNPDPELLQIKAVDDKTLEPCGKPFLHMGNGPLETLAPIPFRQMFFHKEEGCVLADFFNMGNRLIRLNFSLSESEGKDVGQSLGDVPEGLVSRAPLSMLEDSVYFFQSPMDQKSVQRGLWQDDKIRYTPAQERLNSFSLRDPDPFMFNIFFSAFAYSPEKRRFVEASTMQNTIHLYDLEGPFAKTLSINGPVRDYHTMTEDGMEGISLHSQAVQSFSDFFVVLYCEHPLSNPSGQNPSLLCFDWEGNPLMRINLPLPVTAFSINDECSVLYCMDQSTERVVALKVDELFDL